MEYKLTMALILLGINITTVIILITGIYIRIINAMQSKNIKQLHYNFKIAILSMMLLFSNVIALYTGYEVWVKNPDYILTNTIYLTIANRSGILIASFILLFIEKTINILGDE